MVEYSPQIPASEKKATTTTISILTEAKSSVTYFLEIFSLNNQNQLRKYIFR